MELGAPSEGRVTSVATSEGKSNGSMEVPDPWWSVELFPVNGTVGGGGDFGGSKVARMRTFRV